jgi:hypothetical protein
MFLIELRQDHVPEAFVFHWLALWNFEYRVYNDDGFTSSFNYYFPTE